MVARDHDGVEHLQTCLVVQRLKTEEERGLEFLTIEWIVGVHGQVGA
jgi:hypothetical protein